MSSPGAEIEIDEYMVACYGTTEYSEDMNGILLSCRKKDQAETLTYEYKCRELALEEAEEVSAVIPAIKTKVSLWAGTQAKGYAREGYAFSPMFTLGCTRRLKEKEAFTTWLRLERAD